MRYLSVVALFVLLISSYDGGVEAVCGYKACTATNSKLINVHLVPHSHDDVGWLKTVDQYYYGSQNRVQRAGVQYILDNVVEELMRDSKRRFIYVESAFLFKWYNEQPTTIKNYFKKLLNEGRLEIAGGAWSMNDEAAVHYQSVIDQFALGLKAIADNFGVCGRPRVGWQIDPFGHSREMASIFAQMGYDGEFFARTDWVEKSERLNNLTAEMVWKASSDLGESAELFTSLMYNHYSAPPGFCFDTLCSDDPIIDGESYDNNVKTKVDDFIKFIENMAKRYRSNHLMVTMGDDFNYENADMNFKNMDKLIKYVNQRQSQGEPGKPLSKVNLLYSTPSCYLNALHKDLQSWPNKTQDFFPYSSDWHTYWTGYFTSRPTQKRFERDGNHLLQVVKQLYTFADIRQAAAIENLDALRKVMGIFQHHDAITGTEKQHVAGDYDRLMTDALNKAAKGAQLALQKLTNLTNGEFTHCQQLNISVCDATKQGAHNTVVTLVNPLAHVRSQYVRLPVKNENHVVTDAAGNTIISQLVPVAREVIALPYRPNNTSHELVFLANVDKVANYYIKVAPNPKEMPKESVFHRRSARLRARLSNKEKETFDYAQKDQEVQDKQEMLAEPRADIIVKKGGITLTFSGTTGHLINVDINGVSEKIRQDFYYYRGALGNNAEFKNRSSGAYIFRPNGTEILIGSKVVLTTHEGPLVTEVHQHFNEWTSQVIRLYNNADRVEFEWLVGPIPIDDATGKEIITRFTSSIQSKGIFYTDANGREMLRRVRNQREYFKANLTEAISGNYYPITARIALQDEKKRMALLNDRAQGGSSVKDGVLELMVHRRLLRDDAFGVGEALNETAFGTGVVARGKVWLMLNNVQRSSEERFAQAEIHLPLMPFFSNASKATNTMPISVPSFSYLLPRGVNILTLEPHSTTERLLRLENILDGTETAALNFNLREIFDLLHGEEIRETTLDGNMPLSEMKRFKFTLDGSKIPKNPEYHTSKHTPLSAKKKDSATKFNVSLGPMQMRTFIIKVK